MFNNPYDERLVIWRDFRTYLETAENPLEDTVEFYSQAPEVSLTTDPYDPDIWPKPWEILKENNYCECVKILAICYTLQLCDRFIGAKFEINIVHDSEQSRTHFLLFVDNQCIGNNYDKVISATELPPGLEFVMRHEMPQIH